MAVKDALIIGVVIAIQRSVAFLRPYTWAVPAFVFIFAVVVEIQALATGRWAYAPAMPVLPILGVGVSPLLQLPLTSFLTQRFSL
jgi:hypothetical protein